MTESVDAAARAMERIKLRSGLEHETWRRVGADGWSSERVTSLRRTPWQVEA